MLSRLLFNNYFKGINSSNAAIIKFPEAIYFSFNYN